MDTKYFQQALEEYIKPGGNGGKYTMCGDLTLEELSLLLRRAQELKEADTKKEEPWQKFA